MLDILDKVVASFLISLISTGCDGGAGLRLLVLKGPEGSSSRRCLFQTLMTVALLFDFGI
jgi:hypothetical protein